MKNRKAAEAAILAFMDAIVPGGSNRKLYLEKFKNMSDEEFDQYIERLRSEKEYLSVTRSNLDKSAKITIRRNLAIAKSIGHEFFQRLWLTDPQTGRVYLTPLKYLVVHLPFRRQVQILVKKISIPKDNRHIDEMSGQATGDSKGAKLSMPELRVLYARGLSETIKELFSYRGGDSKKFNAMNRMIIETGGVKMQGLDGLPTRAKSIDTLSILLKGMHLDNNL